MTADLDELRSLTPKQVAELTGINRKTLDTWRHLEMNGAGEVGPRWFKVRGVVLYPLSDLRTWLQQRRRSS